MSDPDSVAQAFQAVERRFGTVDILVNNAGITRDAMSYKMTASQFDAAVKVSLYGSFYCVQQVVNGMRKRGYGRIVSMSSLASRGNVGQLNYASAKAGIIAMTQTLSMELGRYNITANCVAPRMINTDIIKTVPEKNMNAILSNIPCAVWASRKRWPVWWLSWPATKPATSAVSVCASPGAGFN